MTVVQYKQGSFTGLSTDTKPTTSIAFAIFIESDTNKVFYTSNSGGTWTQISISASQLLTMSGHPTIDASVTTMRNVTQSALVRPSGDWHGRVISATNNVAVSGLFAGMHALLTGTGATHTMTFDTTGNHDRMSTGTTVNTIVGHRIQPYMIRAYNASLSIKFALNQITNTRMYLGFHSNAGNNPTSSADPLNTFGGCGLWFDSAVSANWKIGQNNAGAATYTDTTIAAGTNLHTLNIVADDTNTKFTFELLSGADAVALTNVNTDPPGQTTAMGIYCYLENTLAATASTMDLYPIHTEQDK